MRRVNSAGRRRLQLQKALAQPKSRLHRRLEALDHPLRFDSHARSLGLPLQATLDHPGMAKVHTHPVRRVDAATQPSRQPNMRSSRDILRLPVQRVVVALLAIVQKAPCRRQEADRLLEVIQVAATVTSLRAAQTIQPVADVGVAQAAGQSLMFGSR